MTKVKNSSSTDSDEEYPYVCLDVSEANRVLMSRWTLGSIAKDKKDKKGKKKSTKDRQQQISYSENLNRSCLPTPALGKSLARLHNKHEYLNFMFRQWSSQKMESGFKSHSLVSLCKEKNNNDRTVALAHEYGYKVCATIMKNLSESYRGGPSPMFPRIRNLMERTRGGGSNNNTHKATEEDDQQTSTTNILKKIMSRTTQPEESSDNDEVHDMGQIGRDFGMAFTFPLACALTYAVQDSYDDVEQILRSLDYFRQDYLDQLKLSGKDEVFILAAYRQAVGWCGWFLYYTHYRMRAYAEVLPVEHLKEYTKEIIHDSIGLIGLKLMHFGFGDLDNDTDENAVANISKRINRMLEDETLNIVEEAEMNRATAVYRKPDEAPRVIFLQ